MTLAEVNEVIKLKRFVKILLKRTWGGGGGNENNTAVVNQT